MARFFTDRIQHHRHTFVLPLINPSLAKYIFQTFCFFDVGVHPSSHSGRHSYEGTGIGPLPPKKKKEKQIVKHKKLKKFTFTLLSLSSYKNKRTFVK